MLAGHPGLFAPPELELLSFDTLAERRAAFTGRDAFWLEGLIRAVMEARGSPPTRPRAVVAGWEAEGLSTLDVYGRLQDLPGRPPAGRQDPLLRPRPERPAARRGGVRGAPATCTWSAIRAAMIRSFEEAQLDQIFFRRDHPFSRRQLAELIWTASHRNILELAGRACPAERRLQVRFEDLVADPAGCCAGSARAWASTSIPPWSAPTASRAGA